MNTRSQEILTYMPFFFLASYRKKKINEIKEEKKKKIKFINGRTGKADNWKTTIHILLRSSQYDNLGILPKYFRLFILPHIFFCRVLLAYISFK